MADTYPAIPFRNALSGPAGEYSDAYQKIVQQYRDDVDSAQRLRNFQEDERAVAAGLPPPSLVAARTALRPPVSRTPNTTYKSGDDIVHVDPATGQASVIYRHPAALPTPLKPASPGYTTKTYEVPAIEGTPADSGHRWFGSNVAPTPAVAAVPAYKISERVLNPIPPLSPQPALAAPQTATASAPAYTPAPMMDGNEIPPPGSIIMGRRNTLAAPPSTTQATPRRFRYENGKLIAQ